MAKYSIPGAEDNEVELLRADVHHRSNSKGSDAFIAIEKIDKMTVEEMQAYLRHHPTCREQEAAKRLADFAKSSRTNSLWY